MADNFYISQNTIAEIIDGMSTVEFDGPTLEAVVERIADVFEDKVSRGLFDREAFYEKAGFGL